MRYGRYWRTGLGLLLTMLLLAAPVGMAAQAEGPIDLEPPLRVADRKAPERDVIVREVPEEGVAPDAAVATQVLIPPVADAYVASGRPNENFGDAALYLGYNLFGEDSFDAQRSYLRFDVQGSLPSGAVIQDARLLLYLVFWSPADDEPMGTRLWSVHSAWDEDTITWNTIPVRGNDYDVTYIDAAEGWYEWQVTDLVEAWYTDVLANNGLLIIGDERVQQRERAFYSRETETAAWPRLVVTYMESDDTEPPEITVDPLPTYVDRDFMVSWSGSDPGSADIASYDVRVRVDGGAWQIWREGVTTTEAQFIGENDRFYEFEARGVDTAGNREGFREVAEASTTADTMPPVTTVDPLPSISGTTDVLVLWSGTDGVSGIDSYDVIYRADGGSWTTLLLDTTAMFTTFNAPGDGVYEFEARARDNVGNEEGFDFEAEASTIVDAEAPFVEPRLWLPAIFRQFSGTP